MKLKGADILINCLAEQGVDTVFGYPGGTVLDIYDALYRSGKINHVLTADEQGAAHAADGFARTTGKVGVCIATSGPGATNLVTGIATAYMDSVPLVAITGNVGKNLLGRDSFQEIDICGITIPITKHNFLVKDVNDLAETIRKAFHIADSGRKGPVLVDILKNVQSEECEYEPKPPVPSLPCAVGAESLKEVAAILNASKRPLIVAGGGVISSDASGLLKQLYRKLDCPVSYTLMGKGAIPEDDPLCLGMIGMHGTVASAKALIAADALIALGTRFSDRVALNRDNFGKGKKIIHIDIDLAEIDKNVRSDIHVMADVGETLKALLPMIYGVERKDWRVKLEAFKRENEAKRDKTQRAYEIITAASRLAPKDSPLITDVGQNQMWAAQYFKVNLPRRFCSSGGLGTMGYGMGGAIGAYFGAKEPCVLVTGDGSFGMNLNELATAVTQRIPLVILLMDNRVLGMVRQWQKIFYSRRFSQTDLDRRTDFVKLAESFGAEGMKLDEGDDVESALKKAFETAVRESIPVLVDCVISPDENVLPMIKPGSDYDAQLDKMEEKND